MATEIKTRGQSRSEIRTYFADFTDDLPEGVSVVSAVASHSPPNGDPVSVSVAVESPVVTVQVGALDTLGTHSVEVLASLSNGDKSSLRLMIPVIY